MAVKIRLSRLGTTNRPFYRVIATDARSKRDGAILANVGTFDPINSTVIQFHEDIYTAWVSKGAIPTDSAKKVYRLYKKSGITKGSNTLEQSMSTINTTDVEKTAEQVE